MTSLYAKEETVVVAETSSSSPPDEIPRSDPSPSSLISNMGGGGSSSLLSSSVPRSRVRKRPVSFGNPALGTYKGFVYTVEENDSNNNNSSSLEPLPQTVVEDAELVENMVAMVDVPPEQVPEGVLHLARSHRPFIDHVRVVIAEQDNNEEEEEDSHDDKNNYSNMGTVSETTTASSSPPTLAAPPSPPNYSSPGASAMENAASILLAETQQKQQQQQQKLEVVDLSTQQAKPPKSQQDLLKQPPQQQQQQQLEPQLSFQSFDDDNTTTKPSRTYLVLFHLLKPEDAQTFVEDLDGQPFTFLDLSVTCTVKQVVALQGEGGVSLMNPMFAPSTKKSPQHGGGLEILPSTSSEKDIDTSTATATINSNKTHHISGETDPNCAVCLERIPLDLNDADKTSILTTVCNHTFHLDCLLQCQDSPCPVCRYDHSGLNEALSQCHICGTTEHNYVCLICGVVSCIGSSSVVDASGASSSVVVEAAGHYSNNNASSCSAATIGATSEGMDDSITNNNNNNNHRTAATAEEQENHARRFFNSHAREHYDETLHAYALDTETQHVWDFCGQGYVHRLLQNKEDGKLVEVHDPNNTTSQERSLRPGLSDAQEGEVVHRKLEGFASQYYTLLKSQLEQQRIFYEGRLQEIRREFAVKQSDASKNKADLLTVLKQERKQLTQRSVTLKRRHTKVTENVAFLKNMNESLESNKAPLQKQIEQAQRERMESRQMIQKYLPALEEKVTTLMLQLEESATVGISGGDSNKQECAPDRKPPASARR